MSWKKTSLPAGCRRRNQNRDDSDASCTRLRVTTRFMHVGPEPSRGAPWFGGAPAWFTNLLSRS